MTSEMRLPAGSVVVVGGGPAGLTAATELAPLVPGRVMVLEREAEAGGIPRHSDHLGYGIRDLHRVLTGPAYARRLVRRAADAGVEVQARSMVTGWAGSALRVTSPQGVSEVHADAIVLATGARERPRPARLIPGDRPAGVFTTGSLQNLVHLQRQTLSGRALVVGAELVSWSAVLTLRHAGAEPVLMTTSHAVPESYRAFTEFGRGVLGVPVSTRTKLVRIIGQGRLRAVELEQLDTGARRIVECENLVLTGDWIPDHELARMAWLPMDNGSGAPLIDSAFRTNSPGIFAIGNLVHPVDTADGAALDGRYLVPGVLQRLATMREETARHELDRPAKRRIGGHHPRPRPLGARSWQPTPAIRLRAEPPLRWISPGLIRKSDGPLGSRRLLAWTNELVPRPTVSVRQGSGVIAERTLLWPASPGRIFRIPSDVLDGIDFGGDPVDIGIR